jgi:hypothetical protein
MMLDRPGPKRDEHGPGKILEVQLLAAALVIGGDEKQQQLLSSDLLVYRWNCYPPNSGRQLVTLTIRLVEESSYTELKAIQNPVRVVRGPRLATLPGVSG